MAELDADGAFLSVLCFELVIVIAGVGAWLHRRRRDKNKSR